MYVADLADVVCRAKSRSEEMPMFTKFTGVYIRMSWATCARANDLEWQYFYIAW